MQLFLNQSGVLNEIPEKPFKLERDLHKLFEANLNQLMGLSVVKSEFTIKNARIDTLAFDPEAKAFTIIEYKRDRNFSVIDQGFMYLALMLENKADFLIEYNEKNTIPMKRDDPDWSQSRVVFVAPSFTDVQVMSTNFKDLPIELWEVVQYENNVIAVREIAKSKSAGSFKPVAAEATGNGQIKKVAEQVAVVTEEDHTAYAGEQMAELYEKFKSAILNLSTGIEVKPNKVYIAFKKRRNIVDIELQKHALKIWINAPFGSINDAKGLAKDMTEIGHFGNGGYEIKVTDDSELEYIMSLVKQVLAKQ
jgi:predicted transport protein